MNKKIALIWPTFSSYHLARFRAVFNKIGDNLLGIEFFGGDGDDETGRWRDLDRQGLPIITLYPNNIQNVSRISIGIEAVRKLKEFQVDSIFVNGYSKPELGVIIKWAKENNKSCFIFFESKKDDSRRFFLIEYIKRRIIRNLNGAICGGKQHKDYLVSLGMPEKRIFFGYDVVDNEFFKVNSTIAKNNENNLRLEYNLPKKYFLCVSRFVKKKNLLRLIAAYGLYKKKVLSDAWSLVFCGEGKQEQIFRKKIKKLGISDIHFVKSQNKHELAIYYGLATCFILPSTIEQWGLVINEAMAAGLPILVTKSSGAAHELLESGVNGFGFNPFDINEIADFMIKIHYLDIEKLAEMGRASEDKIRHYTPNYFADNILNAVSLYG